MFSFNAKYEVSVNLNVESSAFAATHYMTLFQSNDSQACLQNLTGDIAEHTSISDSKERFLISRQVYTIYLSPQKQYIRKK